MAGDVTEGEFLDFGSAYRQAEIKDTAAIAQLLDVAADGIVGYIWQQSAVAGEDPFAYGARECQKADSWCSYSRVVVRQQKTTIQAILLSYPIPTMAVEPAAETASTALLRPIHELEAQALGSYYIDSLAVGENHRHQGIARQLLEIAEGKAIDAGCGRLSLLVFEENTVAHKLYQSVGFEESARRRVVRHACHPYTGDILLLQKPLFLDHNTR